MNDSSIVVSLGESVAFNDIARWNKIFVKWGSVHHHHQSQVTRQEDQRPIAIIISSFTSTCLLTSLTFLPSIFTFYQYLTTFDPCPYIL
jgi:hypothetical protein